MTKSHAPTEPSTARAESASRRAIEGERAKADHDASILAREANTARLKSLRLERDRLAAEIEAPTKAPKAQRPKA